MSEYAICKTERELKDAISNRVNLIRVENSSLVTRIKRIKALAPAAWTAISAAVVVAIAGAVAAAHPPEPLDVVAAPVKMGLRFGGGTAAAVAATSIASTVGFTAAAALITIGLALGRANLNSIYNDYEISESGSNYLLLKRK